MKGNMFYCASQASTATANDERTVMARAIDRHNQMIKYGRRSFTAPCSSADDYVAPYRQLSKVTRIPSSSSSGDRKSVQVIKGRRSNSGTLSKLISSDVSLARKSFGCVAATPTPKTPPGSTRYLLGTDPRSLAGSTVQDTVVKEEGEAFVPKRGSSGAVEEKKKKSSGSGSDKVVVLRVSLRCHCRGCEGKLKKHLSRMQGVTSFNIDFDLKKVTVTGDITPLEVLGCLSKVKNAQFWTPPLSSLPTANPEF